MTKYLMTLSVGVAFLAAMACVDGQGTLSHDQMVSDKGDASTDPIKDGKDGHDKDREDRRKRKGPKIIDLEYDPGKVVKCPKSGKPATVKVCVTAKGSHGKGLMFHWSQKSGPELDADQPEVLSSSVKRKTRTECVQYTLPAKGKKTRYLFKVTVIDKKTGKRHSKDFGDGKDDDGKHVDDGKHHDDGKKDGLKKGDGKYIGIMHVDDGKHHDDGKKDDGKHHDDGKKDDGKHHDDGRKKARDSLKFPVKVICKPKEPVEPIVETCPRTIGFWGTHHELWPEDFDPDDILYGMITWGDVLPPAAQNGACGILGRQYVGARLNEAVEAFVPMIIEDAMDEAEDILGDSDLCPSLAPNDVPDGQRAIELGTLLDEFNNGFYASEDCIDLEELL